MTKLVIKKLIYDWNTHASKKSKPKKIEFDDETLRDGLQSPSVMDPPIEAKIKILHLMEDLGIDKVDIGLPASGERARQDILTLAKEIYNNKMKIKPSGAVRTMVKDIQSLLEVCDKLGHPIEADIFVGSSPIRQYAEDWNLDKLLKFTEESVSFAVKNRLPVMYVTEDTTRADPKIVQKLYTLAIECGAKRICVCDTVGHITPTGVYNLIRFVKKVVDKTKKNVKIDWHGHRDRGLCLANSIAAIEAGATRVHGTALGIGERCGNTPMDLLLVNFRLLGWIKNDLSKLAEYCSVVSKAVGVPIANNYPVVGKDAFRTVSGIHAAAIIKAEEKGEKELTDLVYSGVPAGMFGLSQKIEIGFMSGVSNVIYWLKKRNINPEKSLVDKIFNLAKSTNRILTDEEIMQLVNSKS
ncbi:MAG: 2-isopropylmalate synthase [candidate division Zixibacteria bacterium RBG-1]|nr:MAG: 2-isopropylmalate synthase [candidate division Zixibacteria bacterium RBG-1]